eukprot:28229_6
MKLWPVLLVAVVSAAAFGLVASVPLTLVDPPRPDITNLQQLASLFASGQVNSWYAGAAANTIIPPVNGRTDYVAPVNEFDAESPGTFVRRFDQGRIPVGNGASESHWVRDYLRTYVMALRGANSKIFLIVSADVYMLFSPDLQDLYTGLKARLPAEIYDQLHVFVSATHNHEGPDTSGLSGINRSWYAYFLDTMTRTAIQAIEQMEPVTV